MLKYRQQIGRVIRAYREAKNLSEEYLGELVGVSQQQINRYELGKSGITVDKLIKISELLGIPMNKFFEKIPVKDLFGEMKKEILKQKELLDVIKDNPELARVISFFSKNLKSLKDIELYKLITKLSQIPQEERTVTLKAVYGVLKGG